MTLKMGDGQQYSTWFYEELFSSSPSGIQP